jgi:AcrR family transcriptional regulator
VTKTSVRELQLRETRARIANAALELFATQGYAETTIDQIAIEAGVGRRTIFRYFPTKESMVFDHLRGGREFIIEQLQRRPESEPVLVSLHAVLRQLSDQGYDRRLLKSIRSVLAINADFAADEFATGFQAFEQNITALLEARSGGQSSPVEIQAWVQMAEGWFLTAVRLFFREGRRSLLYYFDRVVEACVASSSSDLAPHLPSHQP